ncbi:MAG: 6-bladed beta-propeller [Geothermobacteraceae bacterium]
MIRRMMRGIQFFALLLTLLGCQGPERVPAPPAVDLSWPDAPESPVVRWVGAIDGPESAGIRPGFWARVGQALFGRERLSLLRPYGVGPVPGYGLVVVDTGAARVLLFDRERQRVTTIAGNGEQALVSPIAAVAGFRGVLAISDSARGRIYAWDEKDGFRLLLANRFDRPTGLAWDAVRSWLWVSETGRHRVVALDADGHEMLTIGTRGNGPGQFNFPTDLFIDAGGRLWVTDSLNARIQVFAPDGTLVKTVGVRGDQPGLLDKPKGLAVDARGRLYVCDALKDAVQVFDEQGRYLFHVGLQGSGPGQFWLPSGLSIDATGRLLVADSYNRRVQVFQIIDLPELAQAGGRR